MEKDLRMEVFASKKAVTATSLHMYKLHTQKIGNQQSIIRGAAWKVKNFNHCGVFEDGKYIYTTEKVEQSITNADFSLEYMGKQKLEVCDNRRVYGELIKYYIMKNLEKVLILDQYRKYSCKSDLTSKWIMTEQCFNTFSSKNKEISLERKYNLWVEIFDDGKAYLKIDTTSVFTSNLTVYDYICKGINPMGMEVKNDWAKNKQTGIITEVCDFTVNDKLDFADSLKAYYIVTKKEGYRVEKLPDDTLVVNVKLQGGSVCPYYPQALKPILTREKIGQIDADFSMKIEKYVKRDMKSRLQLDQDLIRDVGVLEQLNSLEFEIETCPVENLGYRKGNIATPKLVCGNRKNIDCEAAYKVFNYGFYKKPSKKIKIGYIFPVGEYEVMKAVVNAIYTFAVKGKFHNKKDPFILEGLLDIDPLPIIKEEYKLGDITDYKRAARRLKNIDEIDIVIGLVPDEMDDDGPYSPFKSIWAEANIPSQMISVKTAKMFAEEKITVSTSKYYLHNIILGILGKTGGIPWIVKDMPGNVDCFVGIDVATAEKGIHYPACSVVFDNLGRLLGFYKPKTAQKGEKISVNILQDIFDQVIFSYEDQFGKMPTNIMIHRDGFSNEDDEWYEQYFMKKGISYNIVEVRKNISSKLIFMKNGEIENPAMGYCIYNKNKGYLVTTDMKHKKGSPNPILIEKKCGNIPMSQILTQILYLTQLHVGSTQKLRLPITTGYADKICKNKDYVPEGKMNDRLFFL